MFKTTKKIKELAAETFAEIVANGGINTEMVKMTKSNNFDNQKDYNADNNREVSDFKIMIGLCLEKLDAMERYLDVEFNHGNDEEECEGCGDIIEEVESTYTKVKKSKKGKK